MKRYKHKILTLLLALCLVVTMIPVTAGVALAETALDGLNITSATATATWPAGNGSVSWDKDSGTLTFKGADVSGTISSDADLIKIITWTSDSTIENLDLSNYTVNDSVNNLPAFSKPSDWGINLTFTGNVILPEGTKAQYLPTLNVEYADTAIATIGGVQCKHLKATGTFSQALCLPADTTLLPVSDTINLFTISEGNGVPLADNYYWNLGEGKGTLYYYYNSVTESYGVLLDGVNNPDLVINLVKDGSTFKTTQVYVKGSNTIGGVEGYGYFYNYSRTDSNDSLLLSGQSELYIGSDSQRLNLTIGRDATLIVKKGSANSSDAVFLLLRCVTVNGTLKIEDGVTIVMKSDNDGSGKIVNNGTIILPANTTPEDIAEYDFDGNGTVIINNKQYTNAGERIYDTQVDSISVEVGTVVSTDNYTWSDGTFNGKNVWTLKLKDDAKYNSISINGKNSDVLITNETEASVIGALTVNNSAGTYFDGNLIINNLSTDSESFVYGTVDYKTQMDLNDLGLNVHGTLNAPLGIIDAGYAHIDDAGKLSVSGSGLQISTSGYGLWISGTGVFEAKDCTTAALTAPKLTYGDAGKTIEESDDHYFDALYDIVENQLCEEGRTTPLTSVTVKRLENMDGYVYIDGYELQVGKTLRANVFPWGLDNLNYQWCYEDGTKIANATSETYTLTSADIGKRIKCVVSHPTRHGSIESEPTREISSAEPSDNFTVIHSNGTGYTIAADNSTSPVNAGGSYSFIVTIKDGYKKGDNFAVKANNNTLQEVSANKYTITGIHADQTVTVEDVVEDTPQSGNQPGGSTPTPPYTGGGSYYDPVADARTEANQAIGTAAASNTYDAAEQAEVDKIVAQAKSDIAKAFTKTEIEKIQKEALAAIDAVKTSAEKKAEAEAAAQAAKNEKIKKGVQNTEIKAKSKLTKLKNGKYVIKVTWTKAKGYAVDYYEVWRSVKRSSGFKKAFTADTSKLTGTYINTKGLKKGTRYYFYVRGVREIDGEKIYTEKSNKAYRLVK